MTSSLQPALKPMLGLALSLSVALPCAALATAPAPAVVTNLSLRANAYHDNQRYDSSGQPFAAHDLVAFDVTGDSPAGIYASEQRAEANGTVTATTIRLYSRSYTWARSSAPLYSAFADSAARASVTTPFLISGGGTAGTKGTLIAHLHVSGNVEVGQSLYDPVTSADAHGKAEMYFWATGLNATGCTTYADAGCWTINRDYTGDHVNTNNPNRTWELRIPFTFGDWSQFNLQMWATSKSMVTANGNGGWIAHYAMTDYNHTLAWDGIAGVLDAQGQAVTGWSVQSAPGVDLLASAVPEPGAWMLWSGGLLAGAWMRRRSASLTRRGLPPSATRGA
ncbi:hypothetical protein [Roseateles sp.]|uniref:hypothetical protein n=1 Tax=Roseateles sp. TaxID=1971397 RepID=UPI003945DE0C